VSEITPANVVEIVKLDDYAYEEIDHVIDALVSRVEELEQQRDAVVGILQKAQTPALPVGAYSFLALSWRDAIDAALEALGAEETK
jgi:hypothetical protein